jgi:hypothetical protein
MMMPLHLYQAVQQIFDRLLQSGKSLRTGYPGVPQHLQSSRTIFAGIVGERGEEGK